MFNSSGELIDPPDPPPIYTTLPEHIHIRTKQDFCLFALLLSTTGALDFVGNIMCAHARTQITCTVTAHAHRHTLRKLVACH